jgi:GT2 family glycosyltransferase
MQPRVTAILVVRNGEPWLDRTLRALGAQTRRPDALIVVDTSATQFDPVALAAAAPSLQISAPPVSFGEAVALALRQTSSDASGEQASEWIWLLSADTAPEPDALAQLLAAVEVAPSVAIAGPKLVDPDNRAVLLSYGESLSRFGATVRLVEGDLDQAQHDLDGDVLGVSSSAMLVRRELWQRLGGFDPKLSAVDAGLDFSIRARLAGFRVIRVAGALVSCAMRPEDVGRRRPVSPRARRRLGRTAQLHRRLVYAPAPAVPLHWVLLVPLAVVRSVGHLLSKQPAAITGEFAAAFGAAFGGGVVRARRRIRRTRTLGWSAIASLRVSGDQVRELRMAARERASGDRTEPDLIRAPFLGGGATVTALAAVLGLVVFWRLVGAQALAGGALLPLNSDVGALWSRMLAGSRGIGVELSGPPDPFIAVVALLGSLTPWNTSLSLVLLWLTALPFSALAAWWCATRFTERRWPPIVAAVLWMLAPPLLSGLSAGHPTAVIAHLLLPWLVLATIEGARSWSAAATASLLFAAVVACAPVLAPALAVAIVVWAVARPRALVRLLGILIPAAALFAPLVVTQLQRGTPLALVGDPGAVVASVGPSGWQLLLGLPSASSDGWSAFASSIGLPAGLGVLAPAVLLAPLAAVALLAVFLPGSRRAIPALIVSLLGLITALASVHLGVATAGADVVGPWPGSGLSLYWLGLVGASVVALDALGSARVVVGLAVLLTATAAVAPIALAPLGGTSPVVPSDGRLLPALVTAEAAAHPENATLLLTPQDDGSLAAAVEHGQGTTLDEQSTLWSTRESVNTSARTLAQLAGNLASRSGFDPTASLTRFHIQFVVLTDSGGDAAAVRQRVAEALDGSATLSAVGETSAGSLWRVAAQPSAATVAAAPTRTAIVVLTAQGVIIALALLLAIPTGRRRRVVTETDIPADDPAGTFDEDDHG